MQQLRSLVRRLFFVVLVAYVGAVAGLAALWRFQPNRWWVTVSNIFAAHLFWPLAALIPLTARSPSRRVRVLVAIPALLFGLNFGRRFLPRRPLAARGRKLRVMTYNHCYLNRDVAGIVGAIRAQAADIVAVQELTEPVAAAVARDLRAEYPYQALDPDSRQHGLGILSRYPLEDVRVERSFLSQRAVVVVDRQRLNVLNTHPTVADIRSRRLFGVLPVITGYGPGLRKRHLDALVRTIKRTEGPLIMLGDFNMADREPPYHQFTAHMRDVFAEVGWGFGFTFPVKFRRDGFLLPYPLVRIDYIWVRGGITPLEAHVVRANGSSDHCIVVAELDLL